MHFKSVLTLEILDCSGLEEEDIHKEKVKHNIEESYQQLKRIRESKRKGESSHRKQHSGPNWNIQLFKNNEKAMSLKRRLAKQKESLKRNLGRYYAFLFTSFGIFFKCFSSWNDPAYESCVSW